ncbi:MAG TPA: hypothetical protein VH085_00360, partial [Nocardioides sp.]|nr:hypothetical protein [Nocardioides sp.]
AALVLFGLVAFLNHLASPSPQVFRTAAGVKMPGYSLRGALEQPTKGDIARVVRALDTRAQAVLGGDQSAFMSVVDTDQRSFDHAQLVAWGNTRRLPLAKLSFAYDGVLEPDNPLHTATFLARVTTTYEIAGYDTSPVQVDDGFSFVKVHGSWKLAGVSDADDQFAKTALPVPWDGPPIDTYGDGHYLAVVDRGKKALGRRIVALCRVGNREDRTLLGIENTRPTVVVATTQTTGFRKFSGFDAEAVTYPLSGPDGVTPGWRVAVNPHMVAEAAASPVVLPHELTHLATQSYLADSPRWLVEGSAEYVAYHAHGGLAAEMRGQGYGLRRPVQDRLPDTATFYSRAHVQFDYVEGTALVTWIEEHRGRDAVVSLMRAYDDAGGYDVSFDPDTATPGILSKVLGISPTALATAAYAEMESDVPKA